jgi:hypothetical protein
MSSQKSSVFVTFLIKQKSKSPSAASRGKPGQQKKPISNYNCSSLRGDMTKQSPLQILRLRLLQQMKNLLRNDGFLKGCTNRIVVLNLV